MILKRKEKIRFLRHRFVVLLLAGQQWVALLSVAASRWDAYACCFAASLRQSPQQWSLSGLGEVCAG